MAKIKIAQAATFKAPVKIPRVGGEPTEVEFTFKHMDRKEMAAMYDRWNEARDGLTRKAKESDLTWEQVTQEEIALQEAQIKDIVSGWAFDDEFSDESVRELVSTFALAPRAVIDAYQEAYAPARLGN